MGTTQITLSESQVVVDDEELELGIEVLRFVAAEQSKADKARTAIRLTELADKLEVGMGGEGIIIND